MFNRSVMSIDIGMHTTKIVIGKHKGNTVQVLDFISFRNPSNSVCNGYILDIDSMKDKLRQVINYNNMKIKKIIFTLDSTDIISRELTLPYAKDSELKKIVSFELDQYFPINFDKYIVQHKRLEDFKENEIQKTKVLATTLPKLIVEPYLELANTLDLKPVALDIHSNGIAKLFKVSRNINMKTKDNQQSTAIIDLGYSTININIIENNILRFNRLLTIQGKEIESNISNSLNFSLDDAEKVKMQQSTFEEENVPESYFEVKGIINISVNSWLEEIKKIFRFYTSRSPQNKISKIYLFGGHAHLKNIIDYFESYFEISTEVIKNMDSVYIEDCNTKNGIITESLNAISVIIRN